MDALKNMPRYPAYKDSGVDWLGEIPGGWATKRVKFLLDEVNIRSKTGNETLLSLSKYKGVVPKESLEERAGGAASLVGYKVVKKNHLVINKMQAVNGLLAVSNLEGITSPDYSVYRSKDDQLVDIKYVTYLLLQPEYLAEFKRRVTGVMEGFIRLYTDDLYDIKLVCPPFLEQQAIAEFLDEKTGKIDEAIAIKEHQISVLKERKQILIQNAVTRGLNPDAPLRDSGIDWIGQTPAHWDIVPMKFIAEVRDGTHDTPLYVEHSKDARHVITSKDFSGDDICFNYAKNIHLKDHIEISKRSLVESGDVLMSMIGGNIGKSVIVGEEDDFSVKNVAIFKTNGSIYLAKLLKYYFASGLLDKQIELGSRGGAQPFLSLSDIRNLITFKIPNDEIKTITDWVHEQVFGVEKLEQLHLGQIAALKEYKTTLINSAVTGKIKVV